MPASFAALFDQPPDDTPRVGGGPGRALLRGICCCPGLASRARDCPEAPISQQ